LITWAYELEGQLEEGFGRFMFFGEKVSHVRVAGEVHDVNNAGVMGIAHGNLPNV
jgi:hypothetical protein